MSKKIGYADVMTLIRMHWSKISGGMLLVALLGVGGVKVYERVSGDCCAHGASCCHPGASCCSGRHQLAQN